jgi:uncharacterized membrane-anchored protein
MAKTKLKKSNYKYISPQASFFIALSVCVLLYLMNRNTFQQAIFYLPLSKASYVLGSFLLGITTFIYSLRSAKIAKTKEWQMVNNIALIIIVCWLAFYIYGSLLSVFLNNAWDNFYD